MSGQGLPGEPGKHMWLTEAHTSQEAPSSVRGSSSPCDYIDLKTLSILMLLHMSGAALSILLSGNGSIVVKCLVFLVAVIIIYLSSVLTRNHYKKLKKQKP